MQTQIRGTCGIRITLTTGQLGARREGRRCDEDTGAGPGASPDHYLGLTRRELGAIRARTGPEPGPKRWLRDDGDDPRPGRSAAHQPSNM